jgi:hypothetical protein
MLYILQRLKGWGLRRFGFEAEPRTGEESVDESAGGGEVAQAVLHVRPGAVDRVEIVGVAGQPLDGEPVRVSGDIAAHGGGEVAVQVIPDQDDGGSTGVRGRDQALLGIHRAALANDHPRAGAPLPEASYLRPRPCQGAGPPC